MDFETGGYHHYPAGSTDKLFIVKTGNEKRRNLYENIGIPSENCHYYQMENSKESFLVYMS